MQVCADADTADTALRYWFDACPAVAVAFSGGVDSALVAWYARRQLGADRVSAWIADSPSLKRADLAEAETFCRAHDIRLVRIATRELDDPSYTANDIDRCYHCKATLYDTLQRMAAASPAACRICSGTNLDDLGDYRPGLRAAAERAVHHPLQACGIGKELVRSLARRHGLVCWDKPASPCLSSRIPYGEAVTRAKLARIEAAEDWLQAQGFPVCRVRHRGGTAVVEVPAGQVARARDLLPSMTAAFSQHGFAGVTVDPEGFVSGKLNRGVVP